MKVLRIKDNKQKSCKFEEYINLLVILRFISSATKINIILTFEKLEGESS